VNRLVAWIGPYVAIASGAAAAWLGRHFPGLEVDVSGAALAITQAVEFAIGALVTWALHHKYLEGWQQWERGILEIQLAHLASSAAASAPAPGVAASDTDPPAWSPGAFGTPSTSQNGAAATLNEPQNGGPTAVPAPNQLG
jgi:hypothetical protein